MTHSTDSMPTERIQESLAKLSANISRTIRGKESVIEQSICCLIAGGHVLIEDLPGLGKTTLAYSLARSIDCSFSRIQFTSDLLPGDILGVSIYDERIKEFVFKKGPIFANIVLADELNRTTPKTQSALLEVMDRGRVSIDGQTHAIGAPFIVFATQNPVDYEGTFALPDSQMDRFLMRLHMGYPEPEHEIDILKDSLALQKYDSIETGSVITRQEIMEIQHFVGQVYIEDSVLEYLLKIVTATRTESEFQTGISTRGALALKLAAQATALFHGRSFVIPEDVAGVINAVFAHRLSLRKQTSDALEARIVIEGILGRMLNAIKQP